MNETAVKWQKLSWCSVLFWAHFSSANVTCMLQRGWPGYQGRVRQHDDCTASLRDQPLFSSALRYEGTEENEKEDPEG